MAAAAAPLLLLALPAALLHCLQWQLPHHLLLNAT
jgi:hypothetical protein